MGASIVVLGAGGFIGRHVALACARRGHAVVAATRSPAQFGDARITNSVDAFDDPASFRAILPSTGVVFHAASVTTPGRSIAQPQLEGNLRTTLALLEALQDQPGCRLVFVSSAGTLYGDRGQPAREHDPMRPRSYHGAGKAAAELFIHAWATQYEGVAVILRPSNIYGPGQSHRAGFGIIPAAFHCAANDLELTVWGDGSSVRDYLYVDDFVALGLAAMDTPFELGSHVFNAASGRATRLDDLLAVIEQVVGRPIRRRYVPPRRVDVGQIPVDVTAAGKALGWKAGTPLHEGLSRAWHWFRTSS